MPLDLEAPLHSRPTTLLEHVISIPLDLEDEMDNIPSSPINVAESIPLDLEELLLNIPSTETPINVAGTNTPPQYPTPIHQNLSITPPISTLPLSPEHAPEHATKDEPVLTLLLVMSSVKKHSLHNY